MSDTQEATAPAQADYIGLAKLHAELVGAEIRKALAQNAKEVYTLEEAAAYLTVSVDTLASWRRYGGGPKWIIFPSQKGTTRNTKHSMVRYLKKDLDEWLAKQEKYSNTTEAMMAAQRKVTPMKSMAAKTRAASA